MPYYAVGFGSWSAYGYRQATEEEIIKWKNENPDKEEPKEFLIRNVCYDGNSAKADGPFKTAKQAWNAASKLQKGASMMAECPFIFFSGQTLKLSTIVKKIDCQEYEVKDEYSGKESVHKLRFIKNYPECLIFWDKNHRQEIWVRGQTPMSRLARCKLINQERRKTT
jgi:hypothetical protein